MDKIKKSGSNWQDIARKEACTGRGIGVAILDTGIFPHIDFQNRIIAFQDYIHGKTVPYDDNGHGTHVAGIIGGDGKGSRGKYCGIAPGCSLIPIKVLDEKGNGKKEYVINAMQWIKEYKELYHIRIVNISVGTTTQEDNSDLIQAVEDAWDLGLVIVAAAGNLGPHSGSITAPGCSKKVITVGASDMILRNQGISGRGPTKDCISKPDIVAPGNEIISCSNQKSPHAYAAKSGTSMATPMVTGGIALLLEKHPEYSNVDVKRKLKASAKNLGYPHNLQGWGLFQLQRFLQ